MTTRCTQTGNPRQLRAELRQTRLLLASVPHLGSTQPWARAWRQRICNGCGRGWPASAGGSGH